MNVHRILFVSVCAIFITTIILTGYGVDASFSPQQTTSSENISITVNDSSTETTVSSTVPIIINSGSSGAGRDVNGNGNNAIDTDGDGQFEDVTGDGDTNIGDVNALINGYQSGSINDGDTEFNFNGDSADEVNIGDVNALINQAGL